MFIDTGPIGSRPAELVKHGEYNLTNAAGHTFWPQLVYKHATPDGVVKVMKNVRSRESSTQFKVHSRPTFDQAVSGESGNDFQ